MRKRSNFAILITLYSTSSLLAQMEAPLSLRSQLEAPLADARWQIESGKLSEADGTIRGYLQSHRNSADAHYLLGYVLFREHKATESLGEYTEGAKYRRPTAYELETVACDYVLLADYTDADIWFTKALEWDPANFQILYYLGRTKYNENHFEEAIGIFLRCLKLDMKNVKAEDNLGLSYEALGRIDEAIESYQKAMAFDAEATVKDQGPYLDLGSLLVESDRSGEAVKYLQRALEISPQEMRAHRALGKAYLHLNELQNAQTEFEKCVELAPQSAPGHFMLAQVYRKRGLLDKARAETERYTALGSGKESNNPR